MSGDRECQGSYFVPGQGIVLIDKKILGAQLRAFTCKKYEKIEAENSRFILESISPAGKFLDLPLHRNMDSQMGIKSLFHANKGFCIPDLPHDSLRAAKRNVAPGWSRHAYHLIHPGGKCGPLTRIIHATALALGA
jgi:hypothetical protein